MSRAGVIGLSLTAGIVLALAVLWVVFVRAPSPEQVCQHLTALTLRAAGERSDSAQGAIARLEARCVADKDRRMRLRGKIAYARYARCIVAAESLATAEHC